MYGDDLDSLLKGYVSGLEQVVLPGEGGAARSSSGLIDELGKWAKGWGDADGSADVVGRLPNGAESLSRNAESFNVYEKPLSGDNIGALRAVIGDASVARTFVGADDLAGKLAASAGGEVMFSALSALFHIFKGTKSDDVWDGYQANRYSRGPSTHLAEGFDSSTSRISPIDSRYDGLPRPIESGEDSRRRIDVRIEALDARSFLDRKEDIAEAVRQAMLTSGVLGSVLNEY